VSISQKKISLDYFIPDHFKDDSGKLIQEIGSFISKERISKMQTVAQKKSRHVLTIFENTQHAHNISAVLRSIDAFGFLDLFFVYSNEGVRFRANETIDRGASQWLLPKRFTSIDECAKILKENGYRIALVTLPDFSRTFDDYQETLPSFSSNQFPSSEFQNFVGEDKIALVFGSELMGISPQWQPYADLYVSVNMNGFCESLNVSVCAGILLNSLRESLENQKKLSLLSESERNLILEHWICRDYSHAYKYIENRKPELLPWFEFIRSGKFFL
jgi:tRNA (guanosine-2'-O-)-methyltransferase